MPGGGSGELVLQLLVYGLTDGSVVALNAIGFSLAYAVARQINLAHGNVFAFTTIVVASLTGWLGLSTETPLVVRVATLVLLTAVATLLGAGLNLGVERLAFRPFRGHDNLSPVVASVALSFVLLGASVAWHWLSYVAPANTHQGVALPLRAMPDLLPQIELAWGEVRVALKDAFVVLLGTGATLLTTRVLNTTRLGRVLRAVAQDPEMTALCGANPARAQTLAFGLAGGLAGFGAAIFAMYHGGVEADQGLRSGLSAMTAAVLGGVGNPVGALIGGVGMGIFSSFSNYALDARWTPVLVLLLLIGLLAFRPAGLLGSQVAAHEATGAGSPAVGGGSPRTARWLVRALLVLAVVYPWLDATGGWGGLYVGTNTLLLVALATGLNVVVGFAGLLDLGYAAFFAIGGYTQATLSSSGSHFADVLPAFARHPWLAFPLAGLVAAGFGFVFGLPSIRTRGEYLAIVTLAFGEIVPSVIWHLEWTGGPRGMSGIPQPPLVPGASDSPLNAYRLSLLLVVVSYLAVTRLADSRTGRAWAAIRDDDLAASAMGIDASRAKLLAFVLGAGCAGLAGALYGGLLSYVAPEQFDLTVSLMVLAAVVMGERWGPAGAILAMLGIVVYDRWLVDAANFVIQTVGATLRAPGLQSADLRGNNFVVFGLALYVGTLLRARGPSSAPRTAERAPENAPVGPAATSVTPG